MELEGDDVSMCARALHVNKELSVDSRSRRIKIYFVASRFSKLSTERRQRGQSAHLRQCQTDQHKALLRCHIKKGNSHKGIIERLRGTSEKNGHKTSGQGLSICPQGTKISPGLGHNFSAGVACHSGSGFRFKLCASNGGVNLNAADKQRGRTGLNLHVILVILFSTNKLKPEKT